MSLQKKAAEAAMIKWLANPAELGKAPKKIECMGEFVLHGMIYYIFRYKKTALGKWLLGVSGGYEVGEMEHCGHVFSEMQPYDEQTAQEHAIAMVEMIRSFWKTVFPLRKNMKIFYLLQSKQVIFPVSTPIPEFLLKLNRKLWMY